MLVQSVFNTILSGSSRGKELWGIAMDISNFFWNLQLLTYYRGLL